MKRFIISSILSETLVVGFGLAMSSCGSTIPDEVEEPKGGALCQLTDDGQCDEESESRIAIDGDEEDSEYHAPAHKFTPRSHPPHSRAGYVPHPALSALPKLKLRLNECYDRYREKETQIARPHPTRSASPAGQKMKNGKAMGSARVSRRSKERSRPAAKGAADSFAPPAAPAEMAAKREDKAPAQSAPGAVEGEIAQDDELRVAASEEPNSDYEDWGAKIYLSNDDTMSLSSAQRVIYAIDNFLPLPLAHIRPHELLNYFSFETAEVGSDSDFSVLANIASNPREKGTYSLALAVRGRPVDKASRRNAAITFVIDRSGSMQAEGRMQYLKRGLRRMVEELKTGDILHMVLFDHNICTPVENFVVGRDNQDDLIKAIDALQPQGSTDLHRGLSRGYDIADRAYLPGYSNRVVMITDALTNTGVTDERMIAMISKYYEARKIRLSGVGVGREFNDALLDRLTERGKGAYLFLGSEAEVDAVFGKRFISLIETTALDVHFRLHLPKSLRMKVFYGEESSTVKEDVQAIHYFANTSQLFLSDLIARGRKLRPQDDVMLTIEYQDPESGEKRFEEYAFNLGRIQDDAYNVRKGRLIMAWIDLLAQMAARPVPSVYGSSTGSWEDAQGWNICREGSEELARLADGIQNNAEVRRVFDLWEKFCSRYERPRNPVRRRPVSQDDTWPGAQSSPSP